MKFEIAMGQLIERLEGAKSLAEAGEVAADLRRLMEARAKAVAEIRKRGSQAFTGGTRYVSLGLLPEEWQVVADGLETMAAAYDVEADAMDEDGDDSAEPRRLSALAEALKVRAEHAAKPRHGT